MSYISVSDTVTREHTVVIPPQNALPADEAVEWPRGRVVFTNRTEFPPGSENRRQHQTTAGDIHRHGFPQAAHDLEVNEPSAEDMAPVFAVTLVMLVDHRQNNQELKEPDEMYHDEHEPEGCNVTRRFRQSPLHSLHATHI